MAAEVGLEAVAAVVTLQHAHQVADVGGRQPQRLDFAELRVRGNVGNAVPQVRERVVDTLRPPGNNTGILYKVVSAVLIGELTTITRDSYTMNKHITSYRLIIVLCHFRSKDIFSVQRTKSKTKSENYHTLCESFKIRGVTLGSIVYALYVQII